MTEVIITVITCNYFIIAQAKQVLTVLRKKTIVKGKLM